MFLCFYVFMIAWTPLGGRGSGKHKSSSTTLLRFLKNQLSLVQQYCTFCSQLRNMLYCRTGWRSRSWNRVTVAQAGSRGAGTVQLSHRMAVEELEPCDCRTGWRSKSWNRVTVAQDGSRGIGTV